MSSNLTLEAKASSICGSDSVEREEEEGECESGSAMGCAVTPRCFRQHLCTALWDFPVALALHTLPEALWSGSETSTCEVFSGEKAVQPFQPQGPLGAPVAGNPFPQDSVPQSCVSGAWACAQ